MHIVQILHWGAGAARFSAAFVRFVVNGLLLRNGAGELSDLARTVSFFMPTFDDPRILGPAFRAGSTNTGRFQQDWVGRGMDGPMAILDRIANIAGGAWMVTDLIHQFSDGNPDGAAVTADIMGIASVVTSYIAKWLDKRGLDTAADIMDGVSLALGLAGTFFFALSDLTSPSNFTNPNSDDRDNRNRHSGGGGSGFGGFPPIMPMLPPQEQPQPTFWGPGMV